MGKRSSYIFTCFYIIYNNKLHFYLILILLSIVGYFSLAKYYDFLFKQIQESMDFTNTAVLDSGRRIENNNDIIIYVSNILKYYSAALNYGINLSKIILTLRIGYIYMYI